MVGVPLPVPSGGARWPYWYMHRDWGGTPSPPRPPTAADRHLCRHPHRTPRPSARVHCRVPVVSAPPATPCAFHIPRPSPSSPPVADARRPPFRSPASACLPGSTTPSSRSGQSRAHRPLSAWVVDVASHRRCWRADTHVFSESPTAADVVSVVTAAVSAAAVVGAAAAAATATSSAPARDLAPLPGHAPPGRWVTVAAAAVTSWSSEPGGDRRGAGAFLITTRPGGRGWWGERGMPTTVAAATGATPTAAADASSTAGVHAPRGWRRGGGRPRDDVPIGQPGQ